jgi:membrane protease YdiL (CAAX protease family)
VAGASSDLADVFFYLGAIVAVVALARSDLRGLLGISWPGAAVAVAAVVAGAARSVVWVVTLPTHAAHLPASTLAGAIATQLLVVAVAEEAQLRGLVLTRLQAACGLPLAIALSCALFAVLHLQDASWILLPTYFADGVLFCVARLRGRSLLPAIIIHGLFNVTTVCLPVASSVSNAAVYRYEIAVVIIDAIMVALALFPGLGGRAGRHAV